MCSVSIMVVGENLLLLVCCMLEEFDGLLFLLCGWEDIRGVIVIIVCLLMVVFYFLFSVMVCFYEVYLNVCFCILDILVMEGLQVVECGEVEFGINFMGVNDLNFDFDVLVEDFFVFVC